MEFYEKINNSNGAKKESETLNFQLFYNQVSDEWSPILLYLCSNSQIHTLLISLIKLQYKLSELNWIFDIYAIWLFIILFSVVITA